jgi:hypothetical protein
MRLTLNLAEVATPRGVPLGYSAAIYAKKLGGGPRETIGEARGTTSVADTLTITAAGLAPSPGLYRLEAAVTLTLGSKEQDLMVLLEGGLLQIY